MSFVEEIAHLRIPLRDIKKATNNFAEGCLIGRGGSGEVYKGELLLPKLGPLMVAFKRSDTDRDRERQFLAEIETLSRCRHKNIVSFVGYCNEKKGMIIASEFATHGSLDKYVSSAELTWLKRLQICLGTARGLNYLHNEVGSDFRIIHRDMKSSNILFDENWHAKVTDFGLSRNMQHTLVTTNVDGTFGYLDPSYFTTGMLTKESDIYAFGVVLFELLCGRPVIQAQGESNLAHMACQHYEEGRLNEIIDPMLRKQMNPESLNVFSAIPYQCLRKNREERPNISRVVQVLEQVSRLQQEFDKAFQQVADNLARILRCRSKKIIVLDDIYEDDLKVKNMEHMKIPLEDIKLATHDFHDDFKIGIGGYGKVYKADLFHFDFKKYIREKRRYERVSMEELLGYPRRQSTVAIKRLDRKYGQGTAEFLQEISLIPYFTHKNLKNYSQQNLVTLVGFCDEDHERILVYEYAANGSLDKHICNSDAMNSHTWATRLQICLDAANGLAFLHDGVGEHHRIIHRDIKSSNILLGRNYIGMISDFGLSRIGPANLQATFVMTQVAGTFEYIDPQYQQIGRLTKESDVYSFGIVLFEALSGRLARFPRSKDDPQFLPYMARRCFEQKNINRIIDSKFKKEFEKADSSILTDETCPDSINIFAAIAYKCCEGKREDRPTMADVVKELEKAIKSHVKGVEALRTTLDEVRSATNNFGDIKEKGPLGEVYCGELSNHRGQNTVTIKRLRRSVDSDGEDFTKEIARLYSYSHENIVPVLGFCEEQGERIAVFEHMAKGSLKKHLTNTSLTWKQRLKICVDAAKGLAHIHSHAATEQLIHGDIKSSSILLKDDWKAAISDFIIFKGAGTIGYLDPLYVTTGSLTEKSEVYSFGVVLFEILSGRLAMESTSKEEPVVFLAKVAAKCYKNQTLKDIIFGAIKNQIEPKSLMIFSTIAYQCLMEKPEDRPTMVKVVEELENAFSCQDEWEREQKLPSDYKEIIKMSKHPVPSTITNKNLLSLLSSGILLNNEKWFSIRKDGERNEMVSAKRFSYKDVSSLKWRSIHKSRFPKVARISDISNLNIRIQITTQYLTPETIYGAYLVFKICARRKVSSRPLYVNLKYKKAGETLNSYLAEWKEGGSQWLTVELFRFLSNEEGSNDFEVLLESFSSYYCGRGDIYVEGIEFQAIPRVDCKQNKELKDGTDVRGVLKTKLEINSGEQMINDYKEIIKRSGNIVQNASNEELYLLLFKGILIDNGEKFFSLSQVNGKKCHMLPAKAVIHNSSNVKLYKPPTESRCRFAEVVEIVSHDEFRIKCEIDAQLLSSDTTYACFLVFKLSKKCRGLKCPVKARDLLPHKNERTKIISLTPPSMVNLDKIKWIPEERKDGWMEVIVWETVLDKMHTDHGYVPMDLKLTSFEGSMAGLIVYGIEFRPL